MKDFGCIWGQILVLRGFQCSSQIPSSSPVNTQQGQWWHWIIWNVRSWGGPSGAEGQRWMRRRHLPQLLIALCFPPLLPWSWSIPTFILPSLAKTAGPLGTLLSFHLCKAQMRVTLCLLSMQPSPWGLSQPAWVLFIPSSIFRFRTQSVKWNTMA